MDRIEKPRRLEGAATPGPWRETRPFSESDDRAVRGITMTDDMAIITSHIADPENPADAAFIAAARNALPLLLDVVEAARPIIDYAKAHEPANRQDFERLEAALAALDSQP